MISIITGVINEDNTMQILNTATDPNFRRNGIMENFFYSLFVSPDFPSHVQRIDGSLNTGVNKTPRKDLTEEEKESYKNEQREILAEINQSLRESGLAVVTGVNLNEEQKELQKLSEKAQIVLNQIRQSNLWQKVNFFMMQKVFAELPEKKFEFILGEPTGNINLAPSSMVNEQLKNYCTEKLSQNFGLESEQKETTLSASPQTPSSDKLVKEIVKFLPFLTTHRDSKNQKNNWKQSPNLSVMVGV